MTGEMRIALRPAPISSTMACITSQVRAVVDAPAMGIAVDEVGLWCIGGGMGSEFLVRSG